MGQDKYLSNESDRLKAIADYNLLDDNIEQDFQNIVELAASICNVPTSFVSIVGKDRQWFKGKVGLTSTGTARDVSFCNHTIQQNELFVVQDARIDPRFLDNPLVYEVPNIVFYAGFPIKAESYNLGALCVIDESPRDLSENQINSLRLLSEQVTKLIALRVQEHKLNNQNKLINQRNEELQVSNDINKQLMSMISHDVRGPVGSMLTFFKSNNGASNDINLVKKFLPLMETSLKGIYGMVDNMLEWSKHISNDKQEPVNVFSIVEINRNFFASQLEVKSNNFHNSVDEDFNILGNKDAVQFIIRNLIGNSIKYTENGNITVEGEDSGDFISISVIDTGIGMSEILIENILNSNKKVSTQGTQQEKGSGMGINFIQQFLNKMGSELKIKSKEKEGTTISFSLPKAF